MHAAPSQVSTGQKVIDRLPAGARVCVIRLRSLGDCVLTTPALALLKAHRPDLHLTLVVEPRFAELFAGNPGVAGICDKVCTGPQKADLAINLHGGTRSMWITAATRAKYRAGFAHHRYSFIYTDKIPAAQQILGVDRRVHTAEHLASAMFWLGVPQTAIPRAKLAATASRTDSYAVLHPFASAPEKAWPVQRFVAVAENLQNSGLAPVIVAGPQDDTLPFTRFQVVQNAPLTELKNLMAGARLFVGNDSGPAHVAAAFGVPVVVIFGPSDSLTWAPWQTEAQVLKSRAGIAEITIEAVLTAVDTLKPIRVKA